MLCYSNGTDKNTVVASAGSNEVITYSTQGNQCSLLHRTNHRSRCCHCRRQ